MTTLSLEFDGKIEEEKKKGLIREEHWATKKAVL